MSEKLSNKQRLFVEAYLANPNATDAARKAGYRGNDNTLASVGKENLRKPQIAAMVEKRIETAIITADEVLNGIKDIATDPEARDADKLKGFELLGKHLAMWTDKTEHSGVVGITNVRRPKLNDSNHNN